MSEFDKWWEENYMTLSSDRTEAEDIYNLGVESQQAKINDSENTRAVLYRENMDLRENNIDLQSKIDEIKKKYDAMYNAFIVADDCRKEWHESYMSARKERDELQGKLDSTQHTSREVIKVMSLFCGDCLKENKELQGRIDGAMKILSAMRHNGAYKAVDILKGNKDEN